MRRVGLKLLLLVCAISLPGYAVSIARPRAEKPAKNNTEPVDEVVQVKLGESAAELNGPWKFRTGDDVAWAQTDFDDSGWDAIDLTPPAGTADPTLGTSGYVPGWTARGYAKYSGFAWYRLKVNVTGAERRLALKMPDSADDAYQVFVDGQQIGEFGTFKGRNVTAYNTLPQAYRLPKAQRDGTITIAIRMWMDSATPFNSPDAGGLHGPPVLGYASLIGALVQLDWDDTAHAVASGFLETLILIMALLMALALFWLDWDEKAYLWLALVCLVTLLSNATILSINFTEWIGQTAFVILTDVILAPLRIGLWVFFWAYWFHIRKMGEVRRLIWTLVAILMVGTAMLRPPLYGQLVPVHYGTIIEPLILLAKLGLGFMLLRVAYRGFRRHKTEGWMAIAAVLLVFVALYQRELRLSHIKTSFNVLDFTISLGTVSTVLSVLVITVMLLRRFVQAQRLKEQWKMEIHQAQQVQQVLIPKALPQVEGLTIHSEYRPAREVGGDFFQILPGAIAGSVLIVVGDVTGKGLQAGMLVALIIGAIRAAVQHSSDPVEILSEVNKQLCERGHASATCMILRIDSDGGVIVANAGQLPPYLNGKEIEMEGALPIGMIPDSDLSVTSFELAPGDSVLLMSDGIVEAQNAHGEFFGFERINAMLHQRATPKEFAEAAQSFGQEDDILVLEVRRDFEQHAEMQAEPQLAD